MNRDSRPTKPKHGFRGFGAEATVWCRGCESAHAYLKGRDWAIDAAYPDLKVAVEYEGIVWAKKGGHCAGDVSSLFGATDID